MTLDQNAVMRARCAAEAIRNMRIFDRDPQAHPADVVRFAVAIWAIVTGNNKLTDEDYKKFEAACAYALAAETITRSPTIGGSLIK